MNVRRVIITLIVMALGSLAHATDSGGMDAARDLMVTHPSNVPVTVTDVQTMRVSLLPINLEVANGEGTIVHESWYEDDGVLRETFTAKVLVQVPSKVPGFTTLKGAMNADVRIGLETNGVLRAECMLAVQPLTSRTYVEYALDIRALWFEIRPTIGICDIDMEKAGIQVGIPQMHSRDLLTTYVKIMPADEKHAFLDGWCY
ncbi:MAG: hypothetical protein HKN06_10370 [Gammaproteobacteria bacterium]|nr:hypothetical protein [Gammaproteobacteria bacterium]